MSVLPARPPSLLPLVTVKSVLAKLDIDSVVCLTHPFAKLISITDSRLIALFHPIAKVICAYPTRIVFAKQPNELLHVDLLFDGWLLRVVGGHGV